MTKPDVTKELLDVLHSGSLIICAGPGVDVRAGLPTHEELARDLLARVRESNALDADALDTASTTGRWGEVFEQPHTGRLVGVGQGRASQAPRSGGSKPHSGLPGESSV